MAQQFKTFVAGDVLTASEVNNYLMKQAVIACTTADKPGSPIQGMTIYDTDDDALLTYTTATTTWNPPWNLPWGILGYGTRTTNSSSFTTVANIIDDLTVTAEDNRLLKVTVMGTFYQAGTTGGTQNMVLANASNTQMQSTSKYAPAAASSITHTLTHLYATTSSGSHTFRVRGVATDSAVLACTSTTPAWVLVEDVGPASAPA